MWELQTESYWPLSEWWQFFTSFILLDLPVWADKEEKLRLFTYHSITAKLPFDLIPLSSLPKTSFLPINFEEPFMMFFYEHFLQILGTACFPSSLEERSWVIGYTSKLHESRWPQTRYAIIWAKSRIDLEMILSRNSFSQLLCVYSP